MSNRCFKDAPGHPETRRGEGRRCHQRQTGTGACQVEHQRATVRVTCRLRDGVCADRRHVRHHPLQSDASLINQVNQRLGLVSASTKSVGSESMGVSRTCRPRSKSRDDSSQPRSGEPNCTMVSEFGSVRSMSSGIALAPVMRQVILTGRRIFCRIMNRRGHLSQLRTPWWAGTPGKLDILRLVSATTIPRTHLNADVQRPTDCQPLASLVLLGRRTVRPAKSAPPPIRIYIRTIVAACEQFGILETDDSSRALSSSRWPAQASPLLLAGSPDCSPHSCRSLWSPAAMQCKEPVVLRHGFMLPTVGHHEPLPGISCGHAHTVDHHDVLTTPRWTSGSRHLR